MGALTVARHWLAQRLVGKDLAGGGPVGRSLGRKDLTIIRDQFTDGFIPAELGRRAWMGDATDQMLDANVVMSPINWVLRNFTEAEAVVEKKDPAGMWARDDEHAFAQLLARPNRFYGESLLWKASVLSYCLDGNAYWQKVRNRFGEVLGYWYLPHFLVDVKWPDDGSTFISHYEYRPTAGTTPIRLPVDDVIHFRFGLDPRNPRLGMSQLRPLLREVFTDEEASMFSASILSNMGVPGGIIAPDSKDALPSQGDVERMKEYMKGFTGSRRGEWLVLGTPTKIDQFGFDPNNLMLGNLRDISEERVCAALGVPAAVVGFGSGLQQTKVGATMRELRREAWESCIRPMQSDFAKQLDRQGLPDFVAQLRRYRVRFDASAFAASQEQESEKASRIATLVGAGILRVDRAQHMLGLEVDPTREIYLGPKEAGLAPAPNPIPPPSPDDPPPEDPPVDDNAKVLAALAARARGNGAH